MNNLRKRFASSKTGFQITTTSSAPSSIGWNLVKQVVQSDGANDGDIYGARLQNQSCSGDIHAGTRMHVATTLRLRRRFIFHEQIDYHRVGPVCVIVCVVFSFNTTCRIRAISKCIVIHDAFFFLKSRKW